MWGNDYRENLHLPLATCTSATLHWKQKHNEGGKWQYNNDHQTSGRGWELNPAGDLSLRLSVTSPTPCMNQWDAQLTFQRGPRMAWHDIQTSNWPTSGCWSICGLCGGALYSVKYAFSMSPFTNKYIHCSAISIKSIVSDSDSSLVPALIKMRNLRMSRVTDIAVKQILFVGVGNRRIEDRETDQIMDTRHHSQCLQAI